MSRQSLLCLNTPSLIEWFSEKFSIVSKCISGLNNHYFSLPKFRSNAFNTFLRCLANCLTLWSEMPPFNNIHSCLYQERAGLNYYTQYLHPHNIHILMVYYKATLCIIQYNIPFPKIQWERANSHLPFINTI